MIIRLSKNGEYLVAGKVSREATVKQVGSRQAILCDFSVYAGKDENGKKQYVNCKAWDELGGVLSELQDGDAFCGVGKLETREYNGKTYSDLVLDWGNSPMITASTGDIPTASIGSNGETPSYTGTQTTLTSGDFAELDDDDLGDLPF